MNIFSLHLTPTVMLRSGVLWGSVEVCGTEALVHVWIWVVIFKTKANYRYLCAHFRPRGQVLLLSEGGLAVWSGIDDWQ